MNSVISPLGTPVSVAPRRTRPLRADAALRGAAGLWVAVTLLGQWAFVYYLVAFYGVATVTGRFEDWDRNRLLTHGYVAGDAVGNAVFASHVLLAVVVALGGALQLVPRVRARHPRVHRWNGRAFLVAAMLAGLGGLHMSLVRDRPGLDDVALGLDALLIVGFGALAWRAARARALADHRRWALRTFMVTNAVWFQRLGFAGYALGSHALGVRPDMAAFFRVWSFGSYLVPLALLELYLLAARTQSGPVRLAAAGTLAVLSLVTAASTVGFFVGFLVPILAAP
jgi:hypothetical protein